MENYPPEVLAAILQNLTNPNDIYRLSATNKYIRLVSQNNVLNLTSDEFMYIDSNWLNDYQRLENVNDNIIFRASSPNIILPPRLRKFNIQVIVNSNFSPHNVFLNIIDQILKTNLKEYTIRFIVNHPNSPNNDYAVVIDFGSFVYLKNFNKTRKLDFYKDPWMEQGYLYINILRNFKIAVETEIPAEIVKNNLPYLKLVNNTIYLEHVFYANINFYNFINEIVPILKDLESNIEYKNKLDFILNTYNATGFITDYVIKDIIYKYTSLKELQSYGVFYYGYNQIDLHHDDLLNKYLGKTDNYSEYLKRTLNYAIEAFKPKDGNQSPAHYYVTLPMIDNDMYDSD